MGPFLFRFWNDKSPIFYKSKISVIFRFMQAAYVLNFQMH